MKLALFKSAILDCELSPNKPTVPGFDQSFLKPENSALNNFDSGSLNIPLIFELVDYCNFIFTLCALS